VDLYPNSVQSCEIIEIYRNSQDYVKMAYIFLEITRASIHRFYRVKPP